MGKTLPAVTADVLDIDDDNGDYDADDDANDDDDKQLQ